MSKTPAGALAGIPEYDQHPVAVALMPGGMTEEEFDALCDDVQERGILFPITLYQGKVLDGWHRYRAAHRTGTAFRTVTYEGKDPAGYVAACNVLRRKLSSLQRALVGARIHLEHAVPQAAVCKRLGISNTVLSMVLKAIDAGNTRIIRRIENDAEYTRGMLREELAEAGAVHANYGKSAAPNSVFALGAQAPTEGSAQEDDDLLGDDKPLPQVGKKPGHPERRAKDTPAQRMQEHFYELMHDEKGVFLQMVWKDLLPIAEELGLPGLEKTQATTRTITKARKSATKA